ncbi:hypothetical protein [Haladaptatus sp. DYSN1]|uniref:hypothetical protein n=1 Tax=unclassified Haladaptatus TaxID=2622732 RepID=UPI002406A5BE|nr:hypothetical protein [Haladaptatus sp. DYSN1]
MVRPLTEEMEDYAEEISEALTNTQLIHLSHILANNTKALSDYYGENTISTSNVDNHALQLARDHQELVEEFLYRNKNEWTPSNRTRRLLDDLLMENGVTFDELDEYDLSYTEYLLAIYHFYYHPSEEAVQNYDLINAKTLLFHKNAGRAFDYSEQLPLQEDYLERKCSELSRTLSASRRNFHANLLHVEEGKQAIVKLYWERNRTPEMIFGDRLPDIHPKAGTSGIAHRAAYPIKTISLKIENGDDGARVFFSKSTSGWTKKLKRFFSHVFGIDDPFNTLEEKRNESVDRIIGAVREAATNDREDFDDDEESESVFEAVQREVDGVREETVEQARDEEGDEVAEELGERYESIEPTGIIVRNVRDTLTAEFSVKSDSTLEEWMDRNPGAREIIESEVANAEEGSIGLRFRARLTSGDEFDEFVLQDGHWETESGRRVPEQTREILDRLFGGENE